MASSAKSRFQVCAWLRPQLLICQCCFRVGCYSADIGVNTDTTSDLSFTCLVLELVVSLLDCAACPHSQHRRHEWYFSAAFKSAILVNTLVTMAPEVHLNVYASSSVTQPCETAVFDTTCVEH